MIILLLGALFGSTTDALSDCCTSTFSPKACYVNEKIEYNNISTFECFSVESDRCQTCVLNEGYQSDECSVCCAFQKTSCDSHHHWRTAEISTSNFSSNYLVDAFVILSLLVCCIFAFSTKESSNRRTRSREPYAHAQAYYTDTFQQGERIVSDHGTQRHISGSPAQIAASVMQYSKPADDDEIIACGPVVGRQTTAVRSIDDNDVTATASSPLLSDPL